METKRKQKKNNNKKEEETKTRKIEKKRSKLHQNSLSPSYHDLYHLTYMNR